MLPCAAAAFTLSVNRWSSASTSGLSHRSLHASSRTRGAAGSLARSGSLRFAPLVPACHAVNGQVNWQAAGTHRDRGWGAVRPGGGGPRRSHGMIVPTAGISASEAPAPGSDVEAELHRLTLNVKAAAAHGSNHSVHEWPSSAIIRPLTCLDGQAVGRTRALGIASSRPGSRQCRGTAE